jgi:hypothetical protein
MLTFDSFGNLLQRANVLRVTSEMAVKFRESRFIILTALTVTQNVSSESYAHSTALLPIRILLSLKSHKN